MAGTIERHMNADSDSRENELMAMARLLAYALETSKSLNAEVVEYCLEMSMRAVLDQLNDGARATLSASDIRTTSRAALC